MQSHLLASFLNLLTRSSSSPFSFTNSSQNSCVRYPSNLPFLAVPMRNVVNDSPRDLSKAWGRA